MAPPPTGPILPHSRGEKSSYNTVVDKIEICLHPIQQYYCPNPNEVDKWQYKYFLQLKYFWFLLEMFVWIYENIGRRMPDILMFPSTSHLMKICSQAIMAKGFRGVSTTHSRNSAVFKREKSVDIFGVKSCCPSSIPSRPLQIYLTSRPFPIDHTQPPLCTAHLVLRAAF